MGLIYGDNNNDDDAVVAAAANAVRMIHYFVIMNYLLVQTADLLNAACKTTNLWRHSEVSHPNSNLELVWTLKTLSL